MGSLWKPACRCRGNGSDGIPLITTRIAKYGITVAILPNNPLMHAHDIMS
jgi:hypothetical protein